MDEPSRSGPGVPALGDTHAVLERIARRLATRHRRAFSRETVARYVEECAELLGHGARTTRHLPVLVERFADQRLGALARTSGLCPKAVPEVLFVHREHRALATGRRPAATQGRRLRRRTHRGFRSGGRNRPGRTGVAGRAGTGRR
ncbi:three-helix bundle dimerization domain-containing protein [Streptomyces sp. NPDC058001]|uniref:three-helix bundle dimerization domain-containing protein n=1 Tax=Streptomyces sp. NPDC058001 TaxID=3346300 RepID=UPI0036E18B6D